MIKNRYQNHDGLDRGLFDSSEEERVEKRPLMENINGNVEVDFNDDLEPAIEAAIQSSRSELSYEEREIISQLADNVVATARILRKKIRPQSGH